MRTVYLKGGDGTPINVESVDAKEMIASGSYQETAPEAPAQPPAAKVTVDAKAPNNEAVAKPEMTVAQIKAKLAEMNIDIPAGISKKADLQALLDANAPNNNTDQQ